MGSPEALRAALADRYAIERELGAGGMGTVYLARDLKHRRAVAVKVLPPELAGSLGPERFLREIRLTAQLTHPHILALLDSGEAAGRLYYVAPYIDGLSLRERLRSDGTLPVADAARILSQVADALSAAHRFGVIHRDLKPENILLSGRHAFLADFGVAKALGDASTRADLTMVGAALGTPHYMAPEQAAADPDTDHRADLYALGVVGYEMLAGRRPIDGPTAQAILAAHLTRAPEPLESLRPDVPPALAAAVMRCLEKRPEDRWQNAEELARVLESVATPPAGVAPVSRSPARLRRRALAAAAFAAVLLAAGGWYGRSLRQQRWIGEVALPEIERLAREGRYDSAWAVAKRVEEVAANPLVLGHLWPTFTWLVAGLQSEPTGATVSYRHYGESAGAGSHLGTTPLDTVRLPFGPTVLRFELDGYRAVEWLDLGVIVAGAPRLVFDPPDRLPEEMVRVPGWSAQIVDGVSTFSDFFMDRWEVTNREFGRFVDGGGYQDPRYWKHAIVLGGRTLTLEEARELFVDETGRGGPSTWAFGTWPDGQEDYPVSGVSWYEAAAYAEFAGKALPSVHHWRRAYVGGPLVGPMLARSNMQGTGPAPVGRYQGMAPFGTFDMAGNVREWTHNAVGEDRYILGGGWNDPDYRAMDLAYRQPALDRSPSNGIRLVRYLEEGPELAAALAPVEPAPVPDFRSTPPLPDDVFEIYRRMYAYDAGPLDARIERADTARHWVRERISFDAGYGGERVLLHLYLPTTGVRPLQTLVFWPGSFAAAVTSIEQYPSLHVDFVVRSGRALAFPVLKGTLERHDGVATPVSSNLYRERTIQRVRDVMRTVDYLETRDDVDKERLAFYGSSWGGQAAPLVLALEPRFRAAVLDVAFIPDLRAQPEADPLHYLPRVTLPVLMVNGRLDAVAPLETHARPFFDLLGTPAEHKRFVVSDAGHLVDRGQLVRESLDWLDRWLGPVGGR